MPKKGYKQTKRHIKNLIKVRKGIKRSKASKIKYSIAKTDSKHPGWKGNKVGMVALHQWIRRKLGKPKYCEHCKTKKAKVFDWANKSRKYKRELNDWIRLCRKCHFKYDGISKKIWIKRINTKNYDTRKNS